MVKESDTILDDMSRVLIIDLVKKEIPKLDIELKQFTDEEIKDNAITLRRNKDLFDTTKEAYAATTGVQHSIDTGTPRPVCQPPHRVSPKERQ